MIDEKTELETKTEVKSEEKKTPKPPEETPKRVEPELPTIIPDPEGLFEMTPPVEVARKILQVQSKLKAIVPTGKMYLSGHDVSYITKHQILGALNDLLVEAGLACIYGGIHHIQTLDKKTVYTGSPRRENTHIRERFFVTYHLTDVDSGKTYSSIVPADVAGYDSKSATVALAFAGRDFLSQIFLVREYDSNATTMEEAGMSDYSPMSVAKNLNMEDMKETLAIKANAAISRVTRRKVDAEARKRGVVIKPTTSEMDTAELLQVIDLAMDLMNPSTAADHLKGIAKARRAE